MTTPVGDFADYLREILQRRGISQTQLAVYINASPPAMVDWLKGLRRPSPEFIWRIARYDRRDFVELMRLAKWIPDDEPAPVAEPIAPWLNRQLPLFNELNSEEGEALALTARALLELREARQRAARE